MYGPRSSLYRLATSALALSLLACQQPVAPAPVGAGPGPAAAKVEEAAPKRRLLEIRDADALRASFDAVFTPDSDFGGAPDPQALLAAAKTPEGRAATSIAMRGKTGWVYLAPEPYAPPQAGYKLLDQPPPGLTPEEDDRRRMLAIAKTTRDRKAPQPKRYRKFKRHAPGSYQLMQAAGGRTIGDSLGEFARAREIERPLQPDNPTTHLPDDESWQLKPTPPDEYPKMGVPSAYRGADIKDIADCPGMSGWVQYFLDHGGTATVIYPGYPYILNCDRYAGYVAGRGFSGETMQLGSGTYFVTKTAFQEWDFPMAGFNTQVVSTFTVPSRSPETLEPAIAGIQPEEAFGWPTAGLTGHVPTTGFGQWPSQPAGPTLWEQPDGTFGTGAAPDAGVRGAGGGPTSPQPSDGPSGSAVPSSPPPSEPPTTPSPSEGGSPAPSSSPSSETSASPSPSSSPSGIPLTLSTFDSFSPNGDALNDETDLVITADSSKGRWTIRIDSPANGPDIVERGRGSKRLRWGGVIDRNEDKTRDIVAGLYTLNISYDDHPNETDDSIVLIDGIENLASVPSAYHLLDEGSPQAPVSPRYMMRPPSLNGRTIVIRSGKVTKSAREPYRATDPKGYTNAGSALQSHTSPKRPDYQWFPQVTKKNETNELAANMVELILTSPYARFVSLSGSLYTSRYGEAVVDIYAKVPVKNQWLDRPVELGIRIGVETNRFITFLKSASEVTL